MTNKEDHFEWARQLECPSSSVCEPVKKVLDRGISSLLWDELAGVLHPADKALTVRKNILLWKLKCGEKDGPIRHIENTAKIREARKLLDPRIESLEEKCQEHDFLVRQKQQRLMKIKSQRYLLKVKEDLLRMKLDETKSQVEDCREMRSVCQQLMPPNNCQIDPHIVDESLKLVSNISSRADRKIVLNKISENFGTIDISTLWNTLLTRRTRDTEELIALSTREIADEGVQTGENMDILISRARGQYIAAAVQAQICCAKNNEYERQVMEYIEKIEASAANNPYVGEWLPLTLEVKKLEAEQNTIETEIQRLKKTLEQEFELADELSNLEFEIHSIDTKMENCMQDIQKSLVLLKPAASEIAQTRDQLMTVLQKILALREEKQDTSYLDVDPSVELNYFYDSLNLEALDKILLKDNVGAYRHRQFCMSGALESVEAPLCANCPSQFPMIQAPLYQLLNCYKLSMTNSWLKSLENESNTNEYYDSGEWIAPVVEDTSEDLIELLNVTDSTCDRVAEEINQFHSIFDAWKYQTVEKVMSLNDRIVNGASFKEWVKRYDIMVHMMRKKK